MGYYTRCFGHLQITPAISADHVDPKLLDKRRGWFYLETHVSGMIYTIGIQDYQAKAYYIESELKEIIAQIDAYGSMVNGDVECFGEDSTDIWRMVVDSNVITKEKAETRWPDGTKVESRY